MPHLGHFLWGDEPSLLERIEPVKNGCTQCALMFSEAPLIGNSGANPKLEERE
jgi:hypothetical protein